MDRYQLSNETKWLVTKLNFETASRNAGFSVHVTPLNRCQTPISAVFLPLTLITGFFGMNFMGMILLEWRYGLWLTLALMAITLLGMSWYFYRKGWFE